MVATKVADVKDACSGCCLRWKGINCGCLCEEQEYINKGVKVNFHRIADGDVVKDTDGNVLLAHQVGSYEMRLSPYSEEAERKRR